MMSAAAVGTVVHLTNFLFSASPRKKPIRIQGELVYNMYVPVLQGGDCDIPSERKIYVILAVGDAI